MKGAQTLSAGDTARVWSSCNTATIGFINVLKNAIPRAGAPRAAGRFAHPRLLGSDQSSTLPPYG